jgi:uncharacterized membrane protein
MDILVLRLIHIGAGAFWVGAVFTFFLFVQPTAVALGPEGQKFTYNLLHHRRLPAVILSSAAVTVLAGILLLVLTSNGFDPDLLFGVSRVGYTVGGVVAILTFAVGALYVFPRTSVVEQTIGRLLTEGRPPTPDEQQTLARVARESRAAGWIVLAGLVIATVAMATARYWGVVV